MIITNETTRNIEKVQDVRLGNAVFIFSESHPSAKRYEGDRRTVLVLGSPIYGDKIDYETIKEKLLKEDLRHFICQINGSFLFIVYEKSGGSVTIANDRFASIQLYYRADGGLLTLATNYSDIWRRFSGLPGFEVNNEAFYEFIATKRLFGDKTYDKAAHFLNSASVLSYNSGAGAVKIDRYWRPDFAKKDMSVDEAASRLAALVRQSFKRATSDSKQYGILLSGGLDSRTVLAASDKTLSCFTTCEYENNEYEVARELSRSKNYPHYFITKPRAYYSDIIDYAAYLSGAMYIYCNAHFLNLKDIVKEKADVLLHGYGFDFLFQGKYLPGKTHPLLGRISYRRKLLPLELYSKSEIAKIFATTISYRQKSVEPADLVKRDMRAEMDDSLHSEIKKLIDEAAEMSNDRYDWWDYCCFHNVSRHYTWLNTTSIRDFIEERTVAFDNDLFDFFWSLEPSLRSESNMFIKAIKLLDPAVFKVRNANTNLSLDNSPFEESAKLLLNKVLGRTHLNKIFTKSLPPPRTKDRSWPINADSIRASAEMRKRMLGFQDSGRLDKFSFLDMDVISFIMKEHLDGRRDHTNLVLTLLTMDSFLSERAI